MITDGKTDGTRLLVCGTNAYNPKCRYYSRGDKFGQLKVDKEFSGKGFCPYDPRHNSTAIFAGKHIIDFDVLAIIVINYCYYNYCYTNIVKFTGT